MNSFEHGYTFEMTHEDGSFISFKGKAVVLEEIVEDFKSFLLGATFHPDTVNKIQYDQETNHDNDN